jgi:hypothetical protein
VDDIELYEQFKDLCLSFPVSNLSLQKDENEPWYIQGVLSFSAKHDGHQIDDNYSIKIIIPENYPEMMPIVLETGGRIPWDFHHYFDNSLCLGAPLAIKQKFAKEPTLTAFVKRCVVPYLYSFSYKNEKGEMPFGELSHKGMGILEFYKDLFRLDDNKAVLDLIKILTDDNYHGKNRCPCRSRKRIHACHGKLLQKISKLQSQSDFQNEYNHIVRSLMEALGLL